MTKEKLQKDRITRRFFPNIILVLFLPLNAMTAQCFQSFILSVVLLDPRRSVYAPNQAITFSCNFISNPNLKKKNLFLKLNMNVKTKSLFFCSLYYSFKLCPFSFLLFFGRLMSSADEYRFLFLFLISSLFFLFFLSEFSPASFIFQSQHASLWLICYRPNHDIFCTKDFGF